MIYKVIGLMSGSSLDGLDMVYTTITSTGQQWEYEIECAETIPYPGEWLSRLNTLQQNDIPAFLELHTAYGRYLGTQVNDFIDRHQLHHKVHFIASHGHTAYHNPSGQTTFQLGDGAGIAAVTGLTTISDLRNMDMAYGGQGAPIIPITDKLLFKDYKYCLNLGGIANISVKSADGTLHAFDICAANQVLNHFAQQQGQPYDNGGQLAATGTADDQVISSLHNHPYFQQQGAKSLSNDFSRSVIIPALQHLSPADALCTACQHIAYEIQQAVLLHPVDTEPTHMLVTGGGAHNDFLLSCIQAHLEEFQVTLVKPDDKLVNFKEGLGMALSGILRWREEVNTLSSVTGATNDSIGGAVWLAH